MPGFCPIPGQVFPNLDQAATKKGLRFRSPIDLSLCTTNRISYFLLKKDSVMEKPPSLLSVCTKYTPAGHWLLFN